MKSLPPTTDEQLERLIAALARLERTLDAFADAYLNGKFPHGKPVDRWRRSA
jgi:hypothetical protein